MLTSNRREVTRLGEECERLRAIFAAGGGVAISKDRELMDTMALAFRSGFILGTEHAALAAKGAERG